MGIGYMRLDLFMHYVYASTMIVILVRFVCLVYTFILLKDLSEGGSEIIPSDEEVEESEPPLKKSKLQELEPEEKEDVTVSVTLCIS